MDGNPEGTPNPLNPVQGTASSANQPEPSTNMATGTGTFDFIETEQPSSAHDAKPASFAQPTARPASMSDAIPTSSAMPEMASPTYNSSAMPNIPSAPRPSHQSHGVVDPMMRPVSRTNTTLTPEPTRVESNFDSFELDDESLGKIENDVKQTSDTPDLVAKDSIVEPVKNKGSKKKPLIICAIILIMIAIICGATAIAIAVLSNNSSDRVSKAIERLLSGEVSNIIEAKGTITSANSDTGDATATNLPGESLSTNVLTAIDFDGTFDIASSMNKVEASVTTGFSSGAKVTVDIDELRDKDGDTFVKISGLDALVSTVSSNTQTTEPEPSGGEGFAPTLECSDTVKTNCIDAEKGGQSLSGLLNTYGGLLEAADDQWILINDDFGETTSSLEIFDNTTTCLINAFSTLPQYSKEIATKYKANPFITYSTDNLEITKRKNELYKLGLNEEKMSAFVNSLGNNGFINELNACSGNSATNSGANSSLIKEIFANFPSVYVEVDDNNNFTRVYFAISTEVNNVESEIEADINLIYPAELKVTEPEEYIEMSTLLSNVMGTILKTDTVSPTGSTN